MAATIVNLGGKEYVILPRREYERLASATGDVDAIAYATASIAAGMKAAREKAGLTQAELATKIGLTQSMVSSVESGRTPASQKYIRSTLKACGLPKDWKP